jgi:hypothetical protein
MGVGDDMRKNHFLIVQILAFSQFFLDCSNIRRWSA